MLESYSHYLIITANSIITSQVTVFGNSQKKTILDVSFNTRQTLPSGGPQYRASDVKGRIELIFLTTGWSTSLGTNLANGENLTCKAITGIVGSKNLN